MKRKFSKKNKISNPYYTSKIGGILQFFPLHITSLCNQDSDYMSLMLSKTSLTMRITGNN